MKKLLPLLLLSLWSTPNVRASIPEAVLDDIYARALVTFRLGSQKNYYASGVILEDTKERLLVLTNAHVLPRPEDRQHWVGIHGMLGLWKKENRLPTEIPSACPSLAENYLRENCAPVEILAVSPGFDLALVAIRHTPHTDEKYATVFNRRNEELKLLPGEKLKFPAQLTLVGQWFGQNTSSSRSLHLPELRVIRDCPQLFIPFCYRVNLVSWGFSGSPLVAYENSAAAPRKILGIVSHYDALSSYSYVIPMPIAQTKGRELWEAYRNNAGAIYFDFTHPDASDLRFSPDFKTLRYRNQSLGSAEWPKGGGGYSTGGGGYSTGGGGYSTGGGPGTVRAPEAATNFDSLLREISKSVPGLASLFAYVENTRTQKNADLRFTVLKLVKPSLTEASDEASLPAQASGTQHTPVIRLPISSHGASLSCTDCHDPQVIFSRYAYQQRGPVQWKSDSRHSQLCWSDRCLKLEGQWKATSGQSQVWEFHGLSQVLSTQPARETRAFWLKSKIDSSSTLYIFRRKPNSPAPKASQEELEIFSLSLDH